MKKHILLIDSDKGDLPMIIEAFREMEASIKCTYTDCWRHATQMLEHLSVDAIFIHLTPCISDHLRFIQMIKRKRKYCQIPVVVYSQQMQYYHFLACAHGADECAAKPQHAANMKQIVLSMVVKPNQYVHDDNHPKK